MVSIGLNVEWINIFLTQFQFPTSFTYWQQCRCVDHLGWSAWGQTHCQTHRGRSFWTPWRPERVHCQPQPLLPPIPCLRWHDGWSNWCRHCHYRCVMTGCLEMQTTAIFRDLISCAAVNSFVLGNFQRISTTEALDTLLKWNIWWSSLRDWVLLLIKFSMRVKIMM